MERNGDESVAPDQALMSQRKQRKEPCLPAGTIFFGLPSLLQITARIVQLGTGTLSEPSDACFIPHASGENR